MNSKTTLKTIKLLIFVIVVGTPLFYLRQGFYPFILSKTLFFQAAVEFLFFLWLAFIIHNPRYRPRRTPLISALLIFLAIFMITGFLGVDPWRSFWSTYERMLGAFTFLHLAALALVLSSLAEELPWEKIFYASLATTLIIDVLAALQSTIPNLLLEEPAGRTGATFGNPTFLSGYLIFNIFLGAYLIFEKYGELKSKVASGIKNVFLPLTLASAAVIFSVFIIIFFASTRGDILGLAVGALVLLACLAFRCNRRISGDVIGGKKLYAALFLFLIIFGIFFAFTKSSSLWANIPGLNRFKDISFSLQSQELQPRLIALKAAWLGFLERPIFGWGPENFNIVSNKYYEPRSLELSYAETRFDKPHNFIMEDLVTGGILLLFGHLALFAAFLYENFRSKNKFLGWVIFSAAIAYAVRNLFIFDTIGPALMFFLLIGFVDGQYRSGKIPVADSRRDQKAMENNSSENIEAHWKGNRGGENGNRRVSAPVLFIFLAIAVVPVYEFNILTVQASVLQYRGFNDLAHNNSDKAIDDFHSALNLWSPYRWNFVRDYSAAITQAYFYHTAVISDEEAWRALREMEAARNEHPMDAYNHYALVDMYNQISDLNPQKLLKAAEDEATVALKLSPNRQEVYFSLAKTKTLENDYPAAIKLLQQALKLDDKVPDAHFYYGLLAYANHDSEIGYRELDIAIRMGRQWKNFYEPRTVANFFADSGHPQEAIALYQAALNMQDDLETKIKLGVLYYFTGDTESAKKYLEEAGKSFDFKKSPNYQELKPVLDKLNIKY